MSEANDLALFIVEFLFKHGIFACRHGVVAGVMEGKRFVRGGIVGGHDIFVWLPPTGRFLGIEIKIGKDKLRPEQVGFHANIVRMGCLSMVVHSKEDFIEKISKLLNI